MSKTNPVATTNTLSAADQAELLSLPLHTAKDIQSYLKPGEGFERVAPAALKHLAAHPEIAAALKIHVAATQEELARGIHLADRAAVAQKLVRHADENRLASESDVYRVLLKLNRFVQNADDAELKEEFKELGDWVASTHGGGSQATAAPAPEAPAKGP